MSGCHNSYCTENHFSITQLNLISIAWGTHGNSRPECRPMTRCPLIITPQPRNIHVALALKGTHGPSILWHYRCNSPNEPPDITDNTRVNAGYSQEYTGLPRGIFRTIDEIIFRGVGLKQARPVVPCPDHTTCMYLVWNQHFSSYRFILMGERHLYRPS